MDKNNNKRWYFNTTVNPCLNEFAEFFYDKKKVLPSIEVINHYLTPLALCYWYMDNGIKKWNANAYYLCTDHLTLDDLKILRTVFKQKWDIDVNFHKKDFNYRLYIPVREANKFKELIYPMIDWEMKYKLD